MKSQTLLTSQTIPMHTLSKSEDNNIYGVQPLSLAD